jgi:hypothetical protein
MNGFRMVVLAALMAPGAEELRGEREGDDRLAERVARVFSPEMQRTEARLGELAGELAGLPKLLEEPLASRYGFRSDTLLEQAVPHWV